MNALFIGVGRRRWERVAASRDVPSPAKTRALCRGRSNRPEERA